MSTIKKYNDFHKIESALNHARQRVSDFEQDTNIEVGSLFAEANNNYYQALSHVTQIEEGYLRSLAKTKLL